jgi:hypothetical protein
MEDPMSKLLENLILQRSKNDLDNAVHQMIKTNGARMECEIWMPAEGLEYLAYFPSLKREVGLRPHRAVSVSSTNFELTERFSLNLLRTLCRWGAPESCKYLIS